MECDDCPGRERSLSGSTRAYIVHILGRIGALCLGEDQIYTCSSCYINTILLLLFRNRLLCPTQLHNFPITSKERERERKKRRWGNLIFLPSPHEIWRLTNNSGGGIFIVFMFKAQPISTWQSSLSPKTCGLARSSDADKSRERVCVRVWKISPANYQEPLQRPGSLSGYPLGTRNTSTLSYVTSPIQVSGAAPSRFFAMVSGKKSDFFTISHS